MGSKDQTQACQAWWQVPISTEPSCWHARSVLERWHVWLLIWAGLITYLTLYPCYIQTRPDPLQCLENIKMGSVVLVNFEFSTKPGENDRKHLCESFPDFSLWMILFLAPRHLVYTSATTASSLDFIYISDLSFSLFWGMVSLGNPDWPWTEDLCALASRW